MVKQTIQYKDVVYTHFDTNFMWDSDGYPYSHKMSPTECKNKCDDSLIRYHEFFKLKEQVTPIQFYKSRWTSEQLKEIEQDKTNNARMLEQHHKSKLEWSKQLDKI